MDLVSGALPDPSMRTSSIVCGVDEDRSLGVLIDFPFLADRESCLM